MRGYYLDLIFIPFVYNRGRFCWNMRCVSARFFLSVVFTFGPETSGTPWCWGWGFLVDGMAYIYGVVQGGGLGAVVVIFWCLTKLLLLRRRSLVFRG